MCLIDYYNTENGMYVPFQKRKRIIDKEASTYDIINPLWYFKSTKDVYISFEVETEFVDYPPSYPYLYYEYDDDDPPSYLSYYYELENAIWDDFYEIYYVVSLEFRIEEGF